MADPSPQRAPTLPRILITAFASIGGLALLVWQVQRVGVDQISLGFTAVGAGFLVVLVLSFFRLWLRGLAWQVLILERVRTRTVLAATMMGDALGNLTPLSLLVSEPAKAVYLSPAVSPARALASLTAENFFYSVSVAIYVMLGTAAMLVALPVPDGVRQAGFVLVGLMAAVLAVAAWLAWQRPALISALVSRIRVAKLQRLVDQIRDFEVQTYGSTGGGGGRLTRLVSCQVAFHVLSFLEAWFLLWLLTDGQSMPLEAFVLDTFNRVVNILFKVVPLRIGVDEYTSEAVATAIGFSTATGVTLALVRKGRMLVWAAVGLAIFAKRGLRAPDGPRSPSTS